MMRFIAPLGLAVATGIAVAAYAASSSTETERADCPGKIICPLTGAPVCKDRCPLGAEHVAKESATPSCCLNR